MSCKRSQWPLLANKQGRNGDLREKITILHLMVLAKHLKNFHKTNVQNSKHKICQICSSSSSNLAKPYSWNNY